MNLIRNLFFVFCWVASVSGLNSQCTYSCSSYSVSPITFSMYPAAGNTLSMLDDDVTTTLPLNFNFDFYCTTYNQVRICSNGFITFDFGNIPFSGTPYAQSLPSSTVPNAVIAWNWNDLDPSMGGSVTYSTLGSPPNQRFVVTYSNVPLWTPTSPPSTLINTGQIVLHESTHLIEIHVGQARNNGWLTHTEGIEDAGATNAVVVAGRNLSLWTVDQSSHLFSPYVTGLPPTVNGNTLLCEGTTGAFATSTLGNAQGYHWSFPPGWLSSGGAPTMTAIAGASGNVSVAAIYTCGNSPAAVLQVSVIPAPTISISAASPSAFCSNTIFTIVPSGASTYTLFPGNFVSSGAFTTMPASTIVYSVSGSASGCSALVTATAQALVKPSPTLVVTSGTICIGKSFLILPSGAGSYTYSSVFPVVSPQAIGLYHYSVTGTGFNGCVSAPAVSTLSVAPLPTLTISQDRPRICSKETATLTASNAVTFTWSTVSGNAATVAVTPLVSTNYQVFGTDALGCTGSGAIHLVVQNCVGLEESGRIMLSVFPNPSRGKVQIIADEALTFELHDVLGRLLLSGTLLKGSNTLETIGLGHEILVLTARNEYEMRKFRILVQPPF